MPLSQSTVGATGATGATGPASPGYTELISGNDSEFLASVGSWVNTGGTQTWDNTDSYRPPVGGGGGSLKLVTTAQNQRTTLSVAGTFVAGTEYQALLAIKQDIEAASGTSWKVELGDLGAGDTNFTQGSADPNYFDTYEYILVRWVPTSNRTSVSVRFVRVGAETGTITWRIGWARVVRIDSPSHPGLTITSTYDSPPTTGRLLVAGGGLGTQIRSGSNGSKVYVDKLSAGMDDGAQTTGVFFERDYTAIWASHTPGVYSGIGFHAFNLEVGEDFVGINVSEKDASTIQIYDDAGGAYNVELVDQGSFGFKTVSSTESSNLSLLHYIKHGTADPSAGGGVPSAIGSLYGRNNSGVGELWLKTGAGDTAWTKQNTP